MSRVVSLRRLDIRTKPACANTTHVAMPLSLDADSSITTVVDSLLDHAHACGASDIHLDPTTETLRVRLRVDGVLQPAQELPKQIHQEVISRIKVLCGLRTDEHAASQDGRFRHTLQNVPEHVDVRVSIVPMYHGENCVMRLLADKNEQYTLEMLGFSNSDQAKIKNAIRKPHGMILATGPTGSGKTTTLYTLLKMLNDASVSIVTIEDPIEYAVKDIEQIQVNARTGLTFANGLRSILRQDPNIIMVGEIRDTDTASIAVHTALTGHLLLSTLHTNDAATTLPRLLDMGIDGYLVASTVNIAIGQRLVRNLCVQCKEETSVTAEIETVCATLPANNKLQLGEPVWSGKGCAACNNSGYSGRLSINEVLVADENIRHAIARKASAAEVKQLAIAGGMTTMLEDGLNKVRAGLTTLEEVLRVVHE